MIFDQLIIDNFIRWRQLTLDLGQPGLTLIEGRNGAGKSSIFEAILWCLFGKTLRGLTGDEIVNPAADKDCCVTLIFQTKNKEVEVQRYRKHSEYKNELYVFVDGDDVRKWSNRSTQEELENIIGVDFTAFVNSVLFGGGLAKFFASLTDKEQKAVLDALTGVLVYDKALEAVKTDYSVAKQQLSSYEQSLNQARLGEEQNAKELEAAQVKYRNWETDRANFINDKNLQWTILADKATFSENSIVQAKEAASQLQLELNKLLEEKSKKVCPTCKQSLPFEKDQKIREIEVLVRQAERTIYLEQQNLSSYDRQIENVKKDIEIKRAEVNAWGEVAQSLIQRHAAYGGQITNLQAAIEMVQLGISVQEFWLEGFGNAGIKSLRLDSVAPFLTQKANEYSDLLTDGRVHISFHTQSQLKSGDIRDKFGIQIINTDGHPSHKGSSMGERRCIDLCVLWALQDLARNRLSEPINIEFYDEIMDILDDENTERVMTILQNRAKERSVWVISHNDLLKGLFDSVLSINKYAGESHVSQR